MLLILLAGTGSAAPSGQSISLPLLDDSSILAPAVANQGSINLPLIDDGGTLPPEVFEDKILALPLIDDSVIFGPSASLFGSIDLPLIDDSVIFGPTASVAQQIALPLIDDSAVYAPSVSYDQSLDVPLLDGGWVFAPTVAGPVVQGVQVFDGAAEVDESFARSFLDELSDVGSHNLTLANDDPAIPDYDAVVRWRIDGRPVFAGLVEAKNITTYAQGEDVDEVTVCSGRGVLALFDKFVIPPARGLDALPIETVRSFSWVAPDYDTPWPNAKRTLHPSHGRPEWWPDMDAWWVWADRPDVTASSAPGGRCLFRSTFTLAADAQPLRIFVSTDNRGTVWFDGALVAELDDSAHTFSTFIEIPEVTAGEHLIAISALNTGRHGGVIFSVYTVDEDGLLDEVVHRSDASTVDCLSYPYPNNMPGFTAGKMLRLLVEEAQADGELLGVTLGFTDTLDSDGEPWTEPAEITAGCDQTGLQVLQAMADWLIDVQMAPGANVLRAWNFGTRGITPGVTIAATTNPATSEVQGLTHDGRSRRATRLRIRYKQGWTEVGVAGVTAFLDLGWVESETAAKRIGTKLLQFRNVESYAHQLTLAPVSSQPYESFDVGDTVTHPDETGGTVASRVRSVALTEDPDNGEVTWALELNDVRREVEERHDNQLKIAASGTLAGGARVTSKSGDPIPAAVRLSATSVAEFSFQDPIDGIVTAKRPADASGNLIEIHVEVSTEDDVATSSATQVRVLEYVYGQAGFTSLGTVTVPAGEASESLRLDAVKVRRNLYKYRAEVITVGGNVNGVDVQLRAI